MSLAVYTSNLTTIFLFESTTSVSAYGGGAAGLTAETEFTMEGTNAVDKQVTQSADKGFMHDAGTDYVISAKDHFYIWMYSAVFGINDTRDNHGIHVSMGDSTSAFVKFHVDGIDTLPLGGGKPYTIRFVETALSNLRTLVGTPGADPQTLGGGLNVTGNSKDVNLGVDGGRKGSGYLITLGTGVDPEATFAGIASDDESTSEGVFQTIAGGFNLQGKLRIGNGATECEFLDSNVNLFLLDTIHSLTDFTEILIAHENSILTLENINFIALGTNNPGRFEVLTPIVDTQDETNYDNSPTSEGTFVAGTGYSVSDVITLSDNTLITVDSVSSGAVVTFTVDSSEAYSSLTGVANTQVSVLPAGGSGFTLTPDTDNLRTTPTLTCTGLGFFDFGDTILGSLSSLLACRWIGTDLVTSNGATLNGSSILTPLAATDVGALLYNESTDPDGKLDDMVFSKGANAHHAIDFGANVTSDITLRGIEFTGFGISEDGNDAALRFLAGSGSLNCNLIGCTVDGATATASNLFKDDAAGIAVTLVFDPKTVTVHVDDDQGVALQNCRVYLKAEDNTGDMPFEESVTIARSGTVATVAHTGHGMLTGEKVKIEGITDKTEDNAGVHIVTVNDANEYTYVTTDSGSTSYTGTIISTGVLIEGLTNGSGDITFTRTWALEQPVDGRAVKSTDSPVFKAFPLAGNTVSNTIDTDITIRLVLDE